MEEGIEKIKENDPVSVQDNLCSKAVRAGKRTYFFDVKTTKSNDYYLTITESKKRLSKDGKMFYEKHKIFLYKEDFSKFLEGLTEVIDFIRATNPNIISEDQPLSEDFAELEFDHLEKEKI